MSQSVTSATTTIPPPSLPLPRCRQLDDSGKEFASFATRKRQRDDDDNDPGKSIPIKSTYYRYADQDLLEFTWLKSIDDKLDETLLQISTDEKFGRLIIPEICDLDLVEGVCSAKEFASNRGRREELERVADPFYALTHQSSFINTSAYDYACLDHTLQFSRLVPRRERQHIVDIYGSTEGFAEFIHWRDRMTERVSIVNAIFPPHALPYRLPVGRDDLYSKIRQYCPGPEDRWDIRRPENIERFVNSINGAYKQKLVAGSAGSLYRLLPGSEKEIRHFLVSQIVMALNLLDRGGVFICRVFDTIHLFNVQLFYLLHFCFAEIALIKPNTSSIFDQDCFLVCRRPLANSNHTKTILSHLNTVLNLLAEGQLVTSVVDVERFKKSASAGPFQDWLSEQNFRLQFAQHMALKSIKLLAESSGNFTDLLERQESIRQHSNDKWHLPER